MFKLNTAFVVTEQKKPELKQRVLAEEIIYEIDAWLEHSAQKNLRHI
jgi:hypothetical protein